MGTRILYLVRHGNYHTEPSSTKYGRLTAMGRRQAKRIGKRLAAIDLRAVHHSDMACAMETAEIIAAELEGAIPIKSSRLLREGFPPRRARGFRTSPLLARR
jgi:serine/threonine-protein phosphatase PGAM5